jgi:hypothetical protein
VVAFMFILCKKNTSIPGDAQQKSQLVVSYGGDAGGQKESYSFASLWLLSSTKDTQPVQSLCYNSKFLHSVLSKQMHVILNFCWIVMCAYIIYLALVSRDRDPNLRCQIAAFNSVRSQSVLMGEHYCEQCRVSATAGWPV